MKFTMTKIAAAAVLATTAMSAQAVDVATWNLVDYNNDGLMSDFKFSGPPTGNSGNMFGAAVTSAPTPATGPCADGMCDPIAMNTGAIGKNVFTTGFNFGGTGIFMPNIYGNIAADFTAGVLTFSALDFGGEFNGQQFNLAPDGGVGNVTVETLSDLGDGNYGVVVRYVSTIQGGTFDGFQANWRLEGTFGPLTPSAVVPSIPEPETYAMLLAGLGLVGVAARRRKKTGV